MATSEPTLNAKITEALQIFQRDAGGAFTGYSTAPEARLAALNAAVSIAEGVTDPKFASVVNAIKSGAVAIDSKLAGHVAGATAKAAPAPTFKPVAFTYTKPKYNEVAQGEWDRLTAEAGEINTAGATIATMTPEQVTALQGRISVFDKRVAAFRKAYITLTGKNATVGAAREAAEKTFAEDVSLEKIATTLNPLSNEAKAYKTAKLAEKKEAVIQALMDTGDIGAAKAAYTEAVQVYKSELRALASGMRSAQKKADTDLRAQAEAAATAAGVLALPARWSTFSGAKKMYDTSNIVALRAAMIDAYVRAIEGGTASPFNDDPATKDARDAYETAFRTLQSNRGTLSGFNSLMGRTAGNVAARASAEATARADKADLEAEKATLAAIPAAPTGEPSAADLKPYYKYLNQYYAYLVAEKAKIAGTKEGPKLSNLGYADALKKYNGELAKYAKLIKDKVTVFDELKIDTLIDVILRKTGNGNDRERHSTRALYPSREDYIKEQLKKQIRDGPDKYGSDKYFAVKQLADAPPEHPVYTAFRDEKGVKNLSVVNDLLNILAPGWKPFESKDLGAAQASDAADADAAAASNRNAGVRRALAKANRNVPLPAAPSSPSAEYQAVVDARAAYEAGWKPNPFNLGSAALLSTYQEAKGKYTAAATAAATANAERRRVETEAAANAERRRVEAEAAVNAERRRVEAEAAANAERRRVEAEAAVAAAVEGIKTGATTAIDNHIQTLVGLARNGNESARAALNRFETEDRGDRERQNAINLALRDKAGSESARKRYDFGSSKKLIETISKVDQVRGPINDMYALEAAGYAPATAYLDELTTTTQFDADIPRRSAIYNALSNKVDTEDARRRSDFIRQKVLALQEANARNAARVAATLKYEEAARAVKAAEKRLGLPGLRTTKNANATAAKNASTRRGLRSKDKIAKEVAEGRLAAATEKAKASQAAYNTAAANAELQPLKAAEAAARTELNALRGGRRVRFHTRRRGPGSDYRHNGSRSAHHQGSRSAHHKGSRSAHHKGHRKTRRG